MQRVTGLSVVDNQYVFVRGLGERYSNTTLAGSVIPTTEPDKKVVPLDLFPAGADRQRPGGQDVFARQVGRVRRRPRPDRAAEVPAPARARPVLRRQTVYTNATGQGDPAEPARRRATGWATTTARGPCPAAFPTDKIVRRGIYTPDVGLLAPTRSPQFGRLLENRWRPAHRRRRTRAELGRGLRQPLRQARRRRQRDATPTRSSTSRSSAGSSASAEGDELEAVSDYAMQYRHAEGAARRRGQPGLPVLAEPPAVVRELLHPQRARRGAVLRRPEHREQLPLPQLPAAVHRGGAAAPTRLAGEHFFPAWATAASTGARATGGPTATSPTCARRSIRRRSTRRRRSSWPTSRRAASACSTTLTTRRWTSRPTGASSQTIAGRPGHVQVRRQLRGAHPRLRVAPVPVHSHDRQHGRRGAREPVADARRALTRRQNIGTGLPVQRGDAPGGRLRRRSDDHVRLRHGRHRAVGAAPASSAAPASRTSSRK